MKKECVCECKNSMFPSVCTCMHQINKIVYIFLSLLELFFTLTPLVTIWLTKQHPFC